MSVADSLHRVGPRNGSYDGPERRRGDRDGAGLAPSHDNALGASEEHARYRVEWRPLAALTDSVSAWRALARRALEPNVFYEPEFALAAAPAFGVGVNVLLVWSRREPERLCGFFPFQLSRRRYGLFPPVLVGWTHPYAPLGTPLVDRDDAEAVVAAALGHLRKSRQHPRLLLFPLTPTRGRWASALAAKLVRRGGRFAFFNQHARALLAPPRDRSGYLERVVSPRKRKELRRQARRLSDQGAVVASYVIAPDEIASALETFLHLEAQGWKGRAGGAAAMHDAVDTFMREAVRGLALSGGAQLALLTVDGRTIAAGIVLRSGDHAWFWKIAYDETAARASPGVQLTLELTQALLDDATLAQTDSCATADHPMIDKVWQERLELADHLVQIGSGGKMRFTVACHLETLRRAVIGMAKRLRTALR